MSIEIHRTWFRSVHLYPSGLSPTQSPSHPSCVEETKSIWSFLTAASLFYLIPTLHVIFLNYKHVTAPWCKIYLMTKSKQYIYACLTRPLMTWTTPAPHLILQLFLSPYFPFPLHHPMLQSTCLYFSYGQFCSKMLWAFHYATWLHVNHKACGVRVRGNPNISCGTQMKRR